MLPSSRPPHDGETHALAEIVERNIHALLSRRMAQEKRKGLQDQIADRITRFTGSMAFVYYHVVIFGVWIVCNRLLSVPVRWQFDRSFVILAMAASVEAIFLSTFVLISQNRMAALADRRADLDLQIGLLAEHEVTRLITLVTAIAAKMEIPEARDSELLELAKDVAPEQVLEEIERGEQNFSPGQAGRN